MNTETRTEVLERAVALAGKVGYVLVATADADRRPHMAVAKTIGIVEGGLLEVNEWFCPGTMANLKANPCFAVVVWDKETDEGYQISGKMERMLDIGMIEGYTATMQSKWVLPKVQSQLLMRIEKVTDFKRAPHDDAAGL